MADLSIKTPWDNCIQMLAGKRVKNKAPALFVVRGVGNLEIKVVPNIMQRNLLIGTGIVLVVAGLLYPYLKRLPFGRLPGDIAFKSGDTSFFFPIVTCIVISIILSIVLNLFR